MTAERSVRRGTGLSAAVAGQPHVDECIGARVFNGVATQERRTHPEDSRDDLPDPGLPEPAWLRDSGDVH
jgi:hypothetical protein